MAILALMNTVMLPRVPMVNAGKVWLQYFADVFANGRIMLPMKTNTRPPRIDHLGLTFVTNDEATVEIAPPNTPVGRKCTAVTTVLQPYCSWYSGTSWKKTATLIRERSKSGSAQPYSAFFTRGRRTRSPPQKGKQTNRGKNTEIRIEPSVRWTANTRKSGCDQSNKDMILAEPPYLSVGSIQQ